MVRTVHFCNWFQDQYTETWKISFSGDDCNHLVLLSSWETKAGLGWGTSKSSREEERGGGRGEVEADEEERRRGGGRGERSFWRLWDRQERRLLPRTACKHSLILGSTDNLIKGVGEIGEGDSELRSDCVTRSLLMKTNDWIIYRSIFIGVLISVYQEKSVGSTASHVKLPLQNSVLF